LEKNNLQFAAANTLPSEEERDMLRDSVRRALEQTWPVATAVAHGSDPIYMSKQWLALAQQGLTTLGFVAEEGGLREGLIALEEMGRAACPAPLLGALMANLLLKDKTGQAGVASVLDQLHCGQAVLTMAFGAFDGDANAGSATFKDGKLDGKLTFVEDTAVATHLLVLASQADGAPVLALCERNASGVVITETPGLAVPALAQVSLTATPALVLSTTIAEVSDLSRLTRLGLLARALGAAKRSFDMVVDYAKERQQFGQPIGKFQAIQHKLATCLMSLEGARTTLHSAATAFDLGQADWRYYASAAYASASTALRQVSLETHHTFGAIGYAEEHEAPRHFRRTHADLVRHGGVRRAREEVAQTLLDEGRNLPEYDLGAAGNAFRLEVRDWLKEHWLKERRPNDLKKPFHRRGLDKSFYVDLSEKGWNAVSWPKEYGGQARTPLEQLAMIEEFMAVQAPNASRGNIQAFALMGFGTPDQKAEFLPKLYKGETWFCLGYSEPSSGSDLVSLKTTAVKDGNEWVINGQKIWTTMAEHSDYMWLAARTDPDAKPKHAGISIFMVPMNTPGITLQPSMALYGHTFCNEFFDNVRVPDSALVGPVNGGWKILMAALATERVTMGGYVAQARAVFEQLLDYVRQASLNGQPMKDDPIVRDRIGMLAGEIEVARQLVTQSVMIMEQGKVPAHEAAMSKAYTAEMIQRLTETAIDLTGMGAILAEGAEGAITNGRIDQVLRQSIMLVVGGGTNEIQRNIIAQVGLGLPR